MVKHDIVIVHNVRPKDKVPVLEKSYAINSMVAFEKIVRGRDA
jgi:hypothetical protein